MTDQATTEAVLIASRTQKAFEIAQTIETYLSRSNRVLGAEEYLAFFEVMTELVTAARIIRAEAPIVELKKLIERAEERFARLGD